MSPFLDNNNNNTDPVKKVILGWLLSYFRKKIGSEEETIHLELIFEVISSISVKKNTEYSNKL